MSTPTEPDPARRRRTTALAGHTGDEAGARLGLADPDPRVRATALGALWRLGALEPDVLDAASRDPDATVRRRVAELIGRLGVGPGGASPLDAVLEALCDDHAAAVAEMAAWAAGERWALDDDGDPVGAPAGVLARLDAIARSSDDSLAREAAVAALGAIGDPAGELAVVEAMTGAAVLRRRAVLALAAFDGPDAVAALEAALADRDWQVRQAAEDLLGRRPDPDA